MRIIMSAVLLVGCAAASAGEPRPFFAFCMDTHDGEQRTLEQQAAMLSELGFDGAGHLWLDNLEERLATLDAAGLKLFQVSIRVNIAEGQQPYDPRLKESLALLQGRGAGICLLIGGMPPSDPAGDERGVAVIRGIADMAGDVDITLYPHTNDWIARVGDAVRVAKKVDRPNVGVMFNLCHWLRMDEGQDLEGNLRAALPLLQAVSIHGADNAQAVLDGTGNWIQPLGEGDFDVPGLLKLLDDLGYHGPVGLQCWGIPGDARVHLEKSMAAWRQMTQ